MHWWAAADAAHATSAVHVEVVPRASTSPRTPHDGSRRRLPARAGECGVAHDEQGLRRRGPCERCPAHVLCGGGLCEHCIVAFRVSACSGRQYMRPSCQRPLSEVCSSSRTACGACVTVLLSVVFSGTRMLSCGWSDSPRPTAATVSNHAVLGGTHAQPSMCAAPALCSLCAWLVVSSHVLGVDSCVRTPRSPGLYLSIVGGSQGGASPV